MDSLRQRLKRFGADLHEQVDEAFSAFSLETRQGYGDFLRAHGRALLSLEQTLENNGVEALIDDWPQRRRSEAVLADLRALGIAVEAPRVMPPSAGAGWCWGVLYVLEGSRLGARLLLQRLQAAQPAAPAHYLGHGLADGLWPRFLRCFEAQAAACDECQMQQGVADAFGQFLAAAERYGRCVNASRGRTRTNEKGPLIVDGRAFLHSRNRQNGMSSSKLS